MKYTGSHNRRRARSVWAKESRHRARHRSLVSEHVTMLWWAFCAFWPLSWRRTTDHLSAQLSVQRRECDELRRMLASQYMELSGYRGAHIERVARATY